MRASAIDVPADRFGLRADLAAERAQDALDLALLFELRLAPLVAQLDDGQRLHPHRRAAARHVVHDALDLAAHVRLHRDHVAAVAQRDDRFLRHALRERRAEDLLQPLVQPVVQRADLAAHRAERRARLVRHLRPLVDAAVDVLDRPRHRLDQVDGLTQQRQRFEPRDRRLEVARAFQRRGDTEQVVGVEQAAARRLLGERAHVVGAAKAGARLHLQQPARLRRLALPAHDLAVLGRRLQRERKLPPGRERRMPCQLRQDLVELERA